MSDLRDFVDGYFEALTWATIVCDGQDSDKTADDMGLSVTHGWCRQVRECIDFFDANRELLDQASTDYERHGMDFLLTRCGHGAGFWDRGYGKVGDQLTEACRPYGDVNLYIADDGSLVVC